MFVPSYVAAGRKRARRNRAAAVLATTAAVALVAAGAALATGGSLDDGRVGLVDEAISADAMKHKSGARGLRAILEQSMLDIMFELPDQPRGSRYVVTDDDLVIMASEVGVLPVPEENIVCKWRLQPGKMLLIDLEQGRIIDDAEIKSQLANTHPYKQWIERLRLRLDSLPSVPGVRPHLANRDLLDQQQAFGWTQEDIKVVLQPMASKGEEATGSMGNDAPLAVLSDKSKPFYNYFRQLFAQVTNPPIDPIREQMVMSLVSFIGPKPNLLDINNVNPPLRLEVSQPVLSPSDMNQIRRIETASNGKFRSQELDIVYPSAWGPEGIEASVAALCARAADAVRDGYNILILLAGLQTIPDDFYDAAKVDGVKVSLLDKQREIDMRRRLDDLQRQLGSGQKSTNYAGLGLDRGISVSLRRQLDTTASFDNTIAAVGVRMSVGVWTLVLAVRQGDGDGNTAQAAVELEVHDRLAVDRVARVADRADLPVFARDPDDRVHQPHDLLASRLQRRAHGVDEWSAVCSRSFVPLLADANGSFRGPNSQQGYSAFTTWTRGLAWIMLGYPELLEFLEVLDDVEFEAFGGRERRLRHGRPGSEHDVPCRRASRGARAR